MKDDTKKIEKEKVVDKVMPSAKDGGNDAPKKNTNDAPKKNIQAKDTSEKTDNSKNDKNDKGRRGRRPSAFNRSRKPRERQKSEFESRMLSARRVSRVVAGGRRFSLSVAVAVGDKKGRVGIGTGKGPDMAIAMEKAQNQARKQLVNIRLTEEKGIFSEASGKYCASVVQVRPSKGFVAGGAVRAIAELAGIQNINAKIQSRSKSHLNNARAALKALETIKG